MSKIRILNVDIDDVTMDELLARREGAFLTVHVDMLMKFQKNRAFYEILPNFDVITCDSQIIYFASKLLGRPIRERVSGSDYLPRFYTKYADDPSITMFLCGAGDGVAERAAERINAKVGREIVVGTYSPPFGFERDPDEVERTLKHINESQATVLVVGLGTPKEDHFIVDHRHELPNVKLFMPLGGTIEYEAGRMRRPPAWVTTAGFEWLWRVITEPRRRWKRYLVEQPPALWLFALQRFGRYKNPFPDLDPAERAATSIGADQA